MSETNFQPICDYIDKTIEDLKADLDNKFATKSDIERILQAIDAFSKRDKINETEILASGSRINALEKWTIEAAPKVGVQYNP